MFSVELIKEVKIRRPNFKSTARKQDMDQQISSSCLPEATTHQQPKNPTEPYDSIITPTNRA